MRIIRKIKYWLIIRLQCKPCWWYEEGLCVLHIDYIETNCKIRSIEFERLKIEKETAI